MVRLLAYQGKNPGIECRRGRFPSLLHRTLSIAPQSLHQGCKVGSRNRGRNLDWQQPHRLASTSEQLTRPSGGNQDDDGGGRTRLRIQKCTRKGTGVVTKLVWPTGFLFSRVWSFVLSKYTLPIHKDTNTPASGLFPSLLNLRTKVGFHNRGTNLVWYGSMRGARHRSLVGFTFEQLYRSGGRNLNDDGG